MTAGSCQQSQVDADMGNTIPKKSKDASADEVAKSLPPPAAAAVSLTDEQKTLIRDSWKLLEKDIAEVGIIVFINLFETYPNLQMVFLPFTGLVLEDLRKSKLLREHALRVMGAVQRAVFRLNEPEKLDAFLRELGRKHVAYGANVEYIDYIGTQFLSAIRPSLGDHWSSEMEEAWTALLVYIATVMKESMMLTLLHNSKGGGND